MGEAAGEMRITNPLPQRYLTSGAGIGGRIKVRPEDFLVDEIPLYEPEGSGEHLYLAVEKSNVSHAELMSVIRRHFNVTDRAIGFAGMKDKIGVTRQVLSIHLPKDESDMDIRHARIKVLWSARHRNKIRLGHLKGNRFSIRVRDVNPGKVVAAMGILRELERSGVPNYFGSQRFGYRRNNHLIGAALLSGDWPRMLSLLLGSEGGNFPLYQQPRRAMFDQGRYAEAADQWTAADRTERMAITRLARGKSPRDAALAVGDTALSFWISALQSAIFNRVLDCRIEDGLLTTLIEGDIAFKHETRGMFHVERELLASGELTPRLDAFEISPTGPLWGRNLMRAGGRTDEIEQEALEAAGLSVEAIAAGRRSPEGGRRPLRVPLTDPMVEGGADEHGEYIRVSFDLPRGSYATIVLREIMKNDAVEAEEAGE